MDRAGVVSLRRTVIRTLRPGEPLPDGEPRRYEEKRGYVRLRWKVGPGSYVETYERDDTGALVRTTPTQAKRVDYAEAERLYLEGQTLPQIAAALGCDNSTLSRGLRARGVQMRRKRDYAPAFDREELLRWYATGLGVEESAMRAGVGYSAAYQAIREAGVMRQPGKTKKSKPGTTYRHEFRKVRPLIVERSAGRCEVRSPVCTGDLEHVHHRKLRRQGGTNDPANLLAACHSCHSFVHANPSLSYERGWMLRSWQPEQAA